ncbi:hypothetical protein [Flagellimonas eckloniae]|uniref:HPt domain-containing protein n=1 Tax=Flagellimonas eckloniae TaxID=346185 RepID=A0A0Q1BVX3_9FLAO|nr:hypothetical protein [Allomuricauda eckloniae]KQC28668.1 hypothetical protein AAY42_01175 [Allomuricauda eckloniae]
MNADGKMTYIDLTNLKAISRDDSARMHKYLVQFEHLIPERTHQLEKALTDQNRLRIRQILHKMSPQLQFFGIQNIMVTVQRLEFEYETMSLLELEQLVNEIIVKLQGALFEVSEYIRLHFK